MIDGVEPYRPRDFSFKGIEQLGGISFKVYTITAGREMSIPGEMLANAYRYVDAVLPSVRQEEGPDHGLGYVILHAGEMSNWLLIHWWAHSDIAMRLLASAELGMTTFVSQDHRRFHACVWEHVVIDHERVAWVRRAMTRDAQPADYLSDTLDNGSY